MNDLKGAMPTGTDFIRQQVRADLETNRYGGRVVTRFPPEPNGRLHIGHATHVCLNFGIAEEFGGRCHLRYDDTNPERENEEFVRAIQDDIRWLGFDWGEHLYYASDYFERMYACAELLIEKGLAYVDSQPIEAIREGRGTVTEAGVPSPYRDRSVEENLDLFRRMRAGEFPDGAHVLRGKIDMAAPNMLMRDPVFYRIRHAEHYRQGNAWCIYPLYDYAHCLEDAFEDVTHSICTLEFENNRELYDWVLEHTGFSEPRPHQYEWAGLDLENAVLSKRQIGPLVEAGLVSAWDDPRLATLAALRRRGVPPEAIRGFATMVGVSRSGGLTEESKFDHKIRETLNPVAPRVMAVLEPLRVVLTNYPKGQGERFDAPHFPPDIGREGTREVPFGRELWIERADFEEDPPAGFRRLVPGGEVRLRHAYVIRCDDVVKDDAGHVVELRCTYDPETRGGSTPDGRKVRGTIQWVSVEHALEAEVRLFTALLRPEAGAQTGGGGSVVPEVDALGEEVVADITGRVDPDSLAVLTNVKVEPSIEAYEVDVRYQFERSGYFWRDPVDGVGDRLVFNRIVGLKSSWGKTAETTRAATSDGASGAAVTAPDAARPVGPPPSDTRPHVSAERSRARAVDAELSERFDRYREDLGLSVEHADLLSGERGTADFFEAALGVHPDAAAVAPWIVVDLRGLLGDRKLDELPFGGAALGRLAGLVAEGSVSRRAAKDVLARMVEEGGEPAALVDEMGLVAVSDEAVLASVVDDVLSAWPDKVDEYRAGKRNLVGLFVGEVMKATRGAADPKTVRSLLTERLDT